MNFTLLLAAAIAIVQFSIGLRISRFTPEYGSLFAYRTANARRNEDTWYEANHFAGKLLMRSASLILFILVAMEAYAFGRNRELLLVIILSALVLTFVYFRTESYLTSVFFRDGKRRPRF